MSSGDDGGGGGGLDGCGDSLQFGRGVTGPFGKGESIG